MPDLYSHARRPRSRALLAIACGLALAPAAHAAQNLDELSIEDLMNVEVTSVSKRSESAADAAAAVTVISSEDIRRSGATSIPEVLRGVPGLHVAQVSASIWQVTARGFNDQFANKLLVMIDGRSVYTPLFSGTFWDVQDVVLEDVERIEVVRGPGGTVWGANAVNGVINIITKSAEDTQGILTSALAGNQERGTGVARYGGSVAEKVYYRGYVKYLNRDTNDSADGIASNDDWDTIRGGFRIDSEITPSDQLTFQGDYYDGEADGVAAGLLPLRTSSKLSGGNLLARWTRSMDERGELRVQTYYDRTERDTLTLDENRDTFDLTVEHQILLFDRHDVVWGLGYRLLNDENRSDPTEPVSFRPGDRTDNLFSAFVQDQISLFGDRLALTVGTKLEHNDYSGFEFQPSARFLWRPDEVQRVWGAVSRAVRTPSRADHDIRIFQPTSATTFSSIQGSSSFDAEELLAFEFGYRVQPLDILSLDIATYYNIYDNLRSGVIGAPLVNFPGLGLVTVPIGVANGHEAKGYGTEISTRLKPLPWWDLTINYTWMKVNVENGNVIVPLVDPQEDSTPEHQVQVLSRVDLPYGVSVDGSLYWVDETYSGAIDDYVRLDTRVGWKPREDLELEFVGQNLTDESHLEAPSSAFSQRTAVPRSYYGRMTWRY